MSIIHLERVLPIPTHDMPAFAPVKDDVWSAYTTVEDTVLKSYSIPFKLRHKVLRLRIRARWTLETHATTTTTATRYGRARLRVIRAGTVLLLGSIRFVSVASGVTACTSATVDIDETYDFELDDALKVFTLTVEIISNAIDPEVEARVGLVKIELAVLGI